MQQIGNLRQRNEVILHVWRVVRWPLPPPNSSATAGQLVHLARGQQSARNFGADHVNAGLPLRVDAAAQALGRNSSSVISPGDPFFGEYERKSSMSARTVAS